MSKFVEIRSYNLKPGAREKFNRIVSEEAVPMLRRWNVDVVAFAPSPHDDDSFYLIRAYAGLEERETGQDAFYGSGEWRTGPREKVLSFIESYTSIVIEMDEATVEALRK